jgi:hypothetical protein
VGELSFGVANLVAFFEDLFYEIVSGKGSASAAPILSPPCPSVIRKQGTDLSFECRNSIFQGCSRHG